MCHSLDVQRYRSRTHVLVGLLLVLLTFEGLLVPTPALAVPKSERANMYRLYNPWSGEHLYTGDLNEAKSICELGWRWEGIGWVAPSEGDAVYRLYNPFSGDHHYTTSKEEYDYLGTIGWRQEGVGWRSDEKESVPVYREFNPYEQVGTHNYTTSKEEDGHLATIGWRQEGVGWYGSDSAALPIHGFWLETSAWEDDVQLYWIASDAQIAKSRYVNPSDARDSGAGFVAYATDTGAIVRGVYQIDATHVIIADEEGHVAYGVKDGWLSTSDYAGSMQTYYFENDQARVGEFTVSGKTYYARADQGYLMKNATYTDQKAGYTYTTDARGIVTSKTESSLGEVVARVAVACAGTADPEQSIKNTGSNAPWSKVNDSRLNTWFSIADATLGAFGGNTAYSSCAQAAAGVLGATVDPDIAGDLSGKDAITIPSSGPGTVWSYIKEHPEMYQKVTSAEDIQPGDIICSDYHIAIYVGNEAARAKFPDTTATVYQASYPVDYPALDDWPKEYIYNRFGGNVYHVVAKNANPSYPYIDYESLL